MHYIIEKMDKIIMKEDIQYFEPPLRIHPLRLHLAGTSYCDGSYHIERGSGNPVFVFEYVESGRGGFVADGRYYYPSAGDVYCAPGWKNHSYYSDAHEPWVKHWFNLSGRFVEELLNIYSLGGHYFFPACQSVGNIIKDTVANLKGMDTESAHTYMEQRFLLLLQSLSAYHKGTGNAMTLDSPAHKLRAFLLEHLMDETPSLEECAGQTGRSVVQTIRIFRREYGMTPYAFLLEQKMGAAAELLRNSNRTIKEIAADLGFTDEYYFARLFKKKKGAAPGQYRSFRRH